MPDLPVVYVVGGEQEPGVTRRHAELSRYLHGRILRVDLATGTVAGRVRYASPPECRPDANPSVLFKTATLEEGRLYACTTTELITYDLLGFQPLDHVSLPCLNDVHHVRRAPGGGWLVANTGLDMVLELGPGGEVRREWSATDEPPWTRFSREVDYRKVASTKPHRVHPNHVFVLDGEIWVTRCDPHDALCLTAAGRIEVGTNYIHDGLVRDDAIWFTQVDGWLVEVDRATRRVRRRIDLGALARAGEPLGWCRGLEVLDDDVVIVGFTRLRPTGWQEKLTVLKRWAGGTGHGLLPTRLVVFDLKRGETVAQLPLERHGLNAVFSIHVAPPEAV